MLPFAPEPFEVLKARLAAALEPIIESTSVPGDMRRHVLDQGSGCSQGEGP